MPRITFLFTAFALLFIGCSNDDENVDREEYQFYANSTITVNANDFAEIENGGNLVFEYWFTAEDNPNIADDEYSERIIFEIASDAESFLLTDAGLTTANTYFDKYCFCLIEGSIPIENGTVSGIKVSDTRWDVDIDVSFMDFSQVETRSISGTFILESP